MTTPVSNSNSSVYDAAAPMSFADDCDPALASCGAAGDSPASIVTTPPVVIQGDAGARQLLERLDVARMPDCSLEAKEAALSCGKAAVTALVGGLSATTVVSALPAAAVTLVESISCGKDLIAYLECQNP